MVWESFRFLLAHSNWLPSGHSTINTWLMTQMLSYRTVLIAQTGNCSRILPMLLRSSSHQSLASSISASMMSSPHTYPNRKPWIAGLQDYIHTELKGRAATFKERDSNLDAVTASTPKPLWRINNKWDTIMKWNDIYWIFQTFLTNQTEKLGVQNYSAPLLSVQQTLSRSSVRISEWSNVDLND